MAFFPLHLTRSRSDSVTSTDPDDEPLAVRCELAAARLGSCTTRLSAFGEAQRAGHEPVEFAVVDHFGLPRWVRVVMEAVRVLDQVAQFIGVLLRQHLPRCADPLLADVPEGP